MSPLWVRRLNPSVSLLLSLSADGDRRDGDKDSEGLLTMESERAEAAEDGVTLELLEVMREIDGAGEEAADAAAESEVAADDRRLLFVELAGRMLGSVMSLVRK